MNRSIPFSFSIESVREETISKMSTSIGMTIFQKSSRHISCFSSLSAIDRVIGGSWMKNE